MQRRIRQSLLLISLMLCLVACVLPLPSQQAESTEDVNATVPADTDMTPLVLALIAAGGFVFTGMVVYFGLRWWQSRNSMSEVPPEIAPGFPALRDGEKLRHDADYVIQSLRAQSEIANTYTATMPDTPDSVVVIEVQDSSLFGAIPNIYEMHISHPNLLVAVDVFSLETPDGTFSYQVVEDCANGLLSTVQLPLPMDTVLAWGEAMARGLAYLHEHHIAMQQVSLNHIVRDGYGVRLLALENATVLENGPDEQARFHRDVRLLAATLYHLATATPLNGPQDDQTLSGVRWQLVRMASEGSMLSAKGCAERLRSLRVAEAAGDVCASGTAMLSDVGEVREINEDGAGVLPQQAGGVCDVLALVADGVGGHQAGDVASRLTVETITSQFNDLMAHATMPDPEESLAKMAIAANHHVYTARNQAENNMGSTLVMAWCQQNHTVLLNVGDSRAYRLNNETMVQLTIDHSLVERLVAIGQITREEARIHPRKNVIYRMIGERIELDYELFAEDFLAGETLLLCSDGLSDLLTDQQIWRIWRESETLDTACHTMVQAAKDAGGHDNITVVLVRFDKV